MRMLLPGFFPPYTVPPEDEPKKECFVIVGLADVK